MNDIILEMARIKMQATIDKHMLTETSEALRNGLPIPVDQKEVADIIDRLIENFIDHLV